MAFVFLPVLLALSPALAGDAATFGAEFDLQVAHGGFYQPPQTPLAPAHFERALNATVRIGSSGGTCSAIILSDDGYVATALHCIQDCLDDENSGLRFDRKERSGFYSGIKIREQIPVHAHCAALSRSDYWIYEHNLSDPRLVWIGAGRISGDERSLAQLSEPEFATIKNLTGDVVILKYDVPDHAKLPCLPTTDRKPSPNDPVWAIGYPVRGSDFVYDGYKKVVSLGRVRESLNDDPVLQSYLSSVAPAFKDDFWNHLRALWQRPEILMTSLDAAHGNSGGTIIDEQGRLAAVLFGAIKTEDTYNGSTVFGFSAVSLKEQVSRALGAPIGESIFRCSL